MNIQLKEWRVKEISWTSKNEDSPKSEEEKKLQFSFGHAFSAKKDNEFIIGFKINLFEDLFDLRLNMIFVFETDSTINEEFKNSPFLKINAPAIAFPYIRSYISNLTLQSGYSPVILPSINFVALNKPTQ